ncbi:MAG: hypothetical protein GF329_04395 [Candidatus Lokiarchaeota archaeon]|nr:hypothetical protein [Candidatus Lokiarchaeota archaeon]
MTIENKDENDIQEIIEAAERLGVEIDRDQAIKWLADMAAAQEDDEDLTIDEEKGIYGHEVQLIDFDSDDLDKFRKVANVVGIPDTEGVVETAISISGSAAQGKIQRFPGDLDFFERVNIIAPTKEESCKIISDVIRKKALERFYSPTYQLIEVKWGTFQSNFKKNGEELKAGTPMSWSSQEVKQGYMIVKDENDKEVKLDWEYGERDPGWCKLDWLIVEPGGNRVVNVSNMLDVTWESPKGEIYPLDGQLDPYFQEVYIEAGSIPLFTKLKKNLTPEKLNEYVEALEGQVLYYTEEGHENYGKVCKRLYNIYRLTGAHKEAMFIRELFDEPAACLYQVWSFLDTIADAGAEDSTINKKVVAKQLKDLIKETVRVCEGPEEEKVIDSLMRLRDDVTGVEDISEEEWNDIISEARFNLVKMVNEYFYSKLEVLPQAIEYIAKIREKHK